MQKTMKDGLSVGAPLALATGVTIVLMRLDRMYAFEFTREELGMAGPALAGALWAVWWALRGLISILYRGVKNRLEKWAGRAVILAVLASAPIAEASSNRMELIGSDTASTAAELYLDWSVALDLLVIDLERPRSYSAGAIPGVGWGLRWCPEWWTLSDAFLGFDLVLGGGLDIPEREPIGVTVSALFAVTIGNLGSVGAGFRARIGFGDAPDDVVPTIAFGLRYSP